MRHQGLSSFLEKEIPVNSNTSIVHIFVLPVSSKNKGFKNLLDNPKEIKLHTLLLSRQQMAPKRMCKKSQVV